MRESAAALPTELHTQDFKRMRDLDEWLLKESGHIKIINVATTKTPRGRKPLGIKGDLRDFLVRTLYKQYVAWLERRQKRFGLTGWAPIRHAE